MQIMYFDAREIFIMKFTTKCQKCNEDIDKTFYQFSEILHDGNNISQMWPAISLTILEIL